MFSKWTQHRTAASAFCSVVLPLLFLPSHSYSACAFRLPPSSGQSRGTGFAVCVWFEFNSCSCCLWAQQDAHLVATSPLAPQPPPSRSTGDSVDRPATIWASRSMFWVEEAEKCLRGEACVGSCFLSSESSDRMLVLSTKVKGFPGSSCVKSKRQFAK